MDNDIIKGTEVKYLMTGSGFDMDLNYFVVSVYCGGITKEFAKPDLTRDTDTGSWYLCFDTTPFRPGLMTATVTAYVPDEDFPDGLRTEKACCILGKLK